MGASRRRPDAAVTGLPPDSIPRANPPQPYAIHDGLAIYRIGGGQPVLLMPGRIASSSPVMARRAR